MKLIDRYVFREVFFPFVLAVGAFVIIGMADVLFTLADLLINKQVPVLAVLQLLLYKIPSVLVIFFPMAGLFAVMLVLIRMAKDNELTILRAQGINLFRLVGPVVLMALFFSLLSYWNNETLAPWTNHQSNTILRKAVLKKVLPELSQDLFFKDPENRIFYIHEINSETREAHHVLIVEPTGEFPRTITAQKAVLEEGQWRLSEGVIHRYDAQGHLAQEAEFDTMTIAMEKDVSELFTPPKGPKEMSRRELGEQIQLLQKSGLPATELRMEYHFKFAAPFACLIFALMGLALVLALIKQPREWWGVVIAAMLAVLASGFYMTLTAVFRALGHGGFVDPFWAAWGPNGVFVVIAMGVLAWRTNR